MGSPEVLKFCKYYLAHVNKKNKIEKIFELAVMVRYAQLQSKMGIRRRNESTRFVEGWTIMIEFKEGIKSFDNFANNFVFFLESQHPIIQNLLFIFV